MVKKCRILLVDDEKDIVTVIKKGLEKRGLEVDIYTDPLEALSKFTPQLYDLLILDSRMPGMSGIQLLKRNWGNS
jgi:CheY-like chemotaxis protein